MERRSFLALGFLALLIALVLALVFWPTHSPQEIVEGRCILDNGTSLVYVPHTGNRIGLFDGTKWGVRYFPTMRVAIPQTTNTTHDVFVDSRSMTLTTTQWATDTLRVIAIRNFDGAFVRADTPEQRYVCSFRTTENVGRSEDSTARRYVYSHGHMERRTSASWTYPN